jgi:hypothetical protein
MANLAKLSQNGAQDVIARQAKDRAAIEQKRRQGSDALTGHKTDAAAIAVKAVLAEPELPASSSSRHSSVEHSMTRLQRACGSPPSRAAGSLRGCADGRRSKPATKGCISLSVRPVLDGGGTETGMFEVPAGGRRYRALELLVKQKRMSKIETDALRRAGASQMQRQVPD